MKILIKGRTLRAKDHESLYARLKFNTASVEDLLNHEHILQRGKEFVITAVKKYYIGLDGCYRLNRSLLGWFE